MAPLEPSSAREFFDAIAPRYDRVYGLERDASRARMSRILDLLAPSSDVLDLGVGTGRELPALLDAGHRPVGLDFSPEMLALCRKRGRAVPLVEADLWQRLPFDDASFDAVIALHGTLAHPPDDEALARLPGEIARVLRPGGVFAAEVPTPAWLTRVASSPASGALRARAVAPDRCVHEDYVAKRAVEARFLDSAAWEKLFSSFHPRFEPMGEAEMLVVGRPGVR